MASPSGQVPQGTSKASSAIGTESALPPNPSAVDSSHEAPTTLVNDPTAPDWAPFIAAEIDAIRDRVATIENANKKVKEDKDHWYNSDLFSTVLSGVILAVFGFFLTGRLEQSAKERELNIQSAKEMQELLVKISSGNHDDAEAAALSLTTYGRYAIPPLIENLQYGPDRALAAEHGLAALSLTGGAEVCQALTTVLDNRTQRYTAASHTAVIRLLGTADCMGALPVIRKYAELIKRADAGANGLSEYQGVVRDATQANVTQSKQELTNTFRLLHVDYTF